MGYPTAMFRVFIAVAHALRALFRSRFEIAIENAALRQLGRAKDSRRAAQARFPRQRTHCLAIHAKETG
jgi:hypothetical protein